MTYKTDTFVNESYLQDQAQDAGPELRYEQTHKTKVRRLKLQYTNKIRSQFKTNQFCEENQIQISQQRTVVTNASVKVT